MNRILIILAVLAQLTLFSSQTRGASVVTATVTVTNIAQVGTNWIVNGNTRTFTNAAGTPPQSWIQTTNGPGPTASNIYNSIIRYPYLSPNLTIQRTGTNTFTLRGSAISITTNNYFSVSYSTNVGTNLSVVQVPFESVVGDTNRTNNAHWLVDAFNRYPYTNSLATNANVITNLLVKGAQPYQEVLGPIGFRGRTAVNSNFFATNGFTSGLTNINPVNSNLVNYGNAIRSEGSGGNSLQLGSNAQAKGTFSIAVGNGALASNDTSAAFGNLAKATNQLAVAIGNSSIAGGNGSTAIGDSSGALAANTTALGANASSSVSGDMALGASATATGGNSSAIGISSVASSTNDVAVGPSASAGAGNSLAIGGGATASHTNSAAIGPKDFTGTSPVTTDTNQIRIGTASNRISFPGLLESTKSTNSQFAGTNIARGSWSYPAFALATLAAGNNISVPCGTNVYIRCNAGPVSAATICGIVGGATSGGLDGQLLEIFNDTGFGLTFAVSTVDPVAANRINTPLGTDVTIADQASARLMYDGTDARWKLISPYSLTASATNALASIFTNGVAVSTVATQLNVIYGQGFDARTTNASGKVDMELRAKNRTLFSLTSSVTVTNTTSPTSLITNALTASQTILANTLTTNSVLRLKAWGYFTSASATTTELGVRFNNGLVIATNLAALPTSNVNDEWTVDCDIAVRSTGASGSVMGIGGWAYPASTGVAGSVVWKRMWSGVFASAVTVDTTVDQVIDLYVDPGATTHGFTTVFCSLELIQ